MAKELTIKPDQTVVAVGNQIDEIINECLPVATQESQNFVQALTLANGIKALREIFLTDPHIKETVEAMQNTQLGFMTDRTPLTIWQSKQPGSKKELKPYRYEEVAEVCIEAMLQGYRITNNEFNMLVGRFYPAKNGKFRRIQETEGVSDFQFTTTSVAYEPPQGGTQYAKVQAFASWKKDGQLATLGASTGTEDKLIFKIRVNKMMGEDAIIGKALSKLFSRVLMRLEGKIMPEATDVSDDNIVDGEIDSSAPDLTDKLKPAPEGAARDLYGGKSSPKEPARGAETEETTPDLDDIFISRFHGLRKGDEVKTGLLPYWEENRDKLRAASDKVKAAWEEKYQRVYGQPWPQDKWAEIPVVPQVVPGGVAMLPENQGVDQTQPTGSDTKEQAGENDLPSKAQRQVLKGLMLTLELSDTEMGDFYAYTMGKKPTKTRADWFRENFDSAFEAFQKAQDAKVETQGEELK